jgi:hypothetical protein
MTEEFDLNSLSEVASRLAEYWIKDPCYDLWSAVEDAEGASSSDAALCRKIDEAVRRSGANNLIAAEYIINLEARLTRIEEKLSMLSGGHDATS